MLEDLIRFQFIRRTEYKMLENIVSTLLHENFSYCEMCFLEVNKILTGLSTEFWSLTNSSQDDADVLLK
jgi:hypothetical protein